uniref:Uncharacterized protein n=1 Tax=Strix occidentalis caurina TaxID=311401 RepID=A0A8D0KVS6_STROC
QRPPGPRREAGGRRPVEGAAAAPASLTFASGLSLHLGPHLTAAPPSQRPLLRAVPPSQRPLLRVVPPSQRPLLRAVPPSQRPLLRAVPPSQRPLLRVVPPSQRPLLRAVPPSQRPLLRAVPPSQRPLLRGHHPSCPESKEIHTETPPARSKQNNAINTLHNHLTQQQSNPPSHLASHQMATWSKQRAKQMPGK